MVKKLQIINILIYFFHILKYRILKAFFINNEKNLLTLVDKSLHILKQ